MNNETGHAAWFDVLLTFYLFVPYTRDRIKLINMAHRRLNPSSSVAVSTVNGGFGRLTAANYLSMVGSGQIAPSVARRKPRRKQPEEDLQRAVFMWVRQSEPLHPALRWFFHTPNGGARSAGEAGKLKAMGVRPGVADVICPFPSGPWHGFACELKAPGREKTLSAEQGEFLEMARESVWLCGVATTLDQFIDLANRFLYAAGSSKPPKV